MSSRRDLIALVLMLSAVLCIGLVGSIADLATRQRTMEMCTYLVLVVGLSVFVSNSGVISFGSMAFATVGAYSAALVTATPGVKSVLLPQLPVWLQEIELPTYLGALVGIGVAVLLACLTAVPLSRLDGIAASISTLALIAIVYNVVRNWDGVTGGTGSFPGIPLASSSWAYCGCAMAVVVVAFVFERSRVGLKLQAAREDAPAARSIGIRIARERRIAFVLSAAIMALGGVLFSQLIGVLSPNTLYLGITFLTIAMLVVGGINSLVGAVLGTILVYLFDQVLRSAESTSLGPIQGRPGMTEFLLAAFMLLVLILSPRGLAYRPVAVLRELTWKIGKRSRDGLSAGQQRREGDSFKDGPPERAQLQHLSKLLQSQLPDTATSTDVLELRGVTVTFEGVNALNEINLRIRCGETLGLIGPNGAGKSTLVNVATGFLRPTQGNVVLGRIDITGATPESRVRLGIARSFQAVRPFGELNVFQNLEVSALSSGTDRATARLLAGTLLEEFKFSDRSSVLARTLPAGEQRKLGVLRALASRPRFILLDEPAAGLDETETAELVQFIRELSAVHEVGLLIIEHDMSVIMPLCERIHVLNFGHTIAEDAPAAIRKDPAVLSAYLGTGPEVDFAGPIPGKS